MIDPFEEARVEVSPLGIMYASCNVCSERYGWVVRLRGLEFRLCLKHMRQLRKATHRG
jgi:hypothetical protein